MVKVEITVEYPASRKDWYSPIPKKFKQKKLTVTDKLIFIQPHVWGEKVGMKAYFFNGTTAYWHFTTKNIEIKYKS